MNSKKLNNITNNTYSDEWYTDQKTVDLCWELLGVKPNEIICCPFDSEDSLFVKKAISNGNPVLYGMNDFVGSTHYVFDKLVTNPPFSIKDSVIQSVYGYGKPAALILPLDSLGGVKRHGMYAKYGEPTVYLPTKRISYFDQTWQKRQGSNFHSVVALFNHSEKPGIIWEFRKDNNGNL
jgi:hypothetical protein